MNIMQSRNRSGFTLIELLVVIAIIAILAAILFPVFAQAKTAAKKAAGTSSLKQLAIGHMLYADDHDDLVSPRFRGGYGAPNGGDPENSMSWDKLIQPYLKNYDVLYASVDRRSTYQTPFGNFRRSYAVARNVFTGVQPRRGFKGIYNLLPEQYKSSRSITSIPEQANTIMIAEQRQSVFESNDPWKDDRWGDGADMENTRRADWKNPNDRRAQYGNVDNAFAEGSLWAFADGHVAYRKANGAASDGTIQGTLFPGYEQKAGAWVTGNGDPFYDRGISCLDSLPAGGAADCKLPGE